jgi:uncharacterized membrane protein YccC
MRQQIQRYFKAIIRVFKSEHTVDALRNTIAVVLPILVFFYRGWPTTAVGVGIGALMICMTDLPGNRGDKFRTAWISVLIFTFVAMLTAWSTSIPILMIAVVVLLTFFLTMLGILGHRMAAIGLMGIILATFTIGLKPKDALLYGSYICLGGIWYYTISLLQIYLFPYRSLRRAITQTERDTAALLKLRAQGYNPAVNLLGFNEKNMRLHLKLASQHELIRQLLLSDRRAMGQLNTKGRIFLEKSINLIDLYEQASAVHYDYPYLRKQFATAGVLPWLEQAIELLAKQLIKPNDGAHAERFKQKRLALAQRAEELNTDQSVLLKQILGNIDEIYGLILAIHQPTLNQQLDEHTVRYRDFLTVAPVQAEAIKKHFSMRSPIFRFSLRLSALCLVALILITWFSHEHYSYWLLLTMVIVSRPSYGQTMKRNGERLGGTIIGLAMGWGIVTMVDVPWQLFISVISLFCFFAFNRVAYGMSVIGITVAVILCLNVYEGDLWQLVSDRILFTIAGVLLCLGATFLFPIWNAPRLNKLMAEVMKANASYFQSVMSLVPHRVETIHQTRLARKLSHQQLSALSEAIQASQKEPFRKKLNWPLIKRIQLLNYQFNVLTATYAGMQKQGSTYLSAIELDKILVYLQRCGIAMEDFDLHAPLILPVWSEKPMNLLEVSGHLANIVTASQVNN